MGACLYQRKWPQVAIYRDKHDGKYFQVLPHFNPVIPGLKYEFKELKDGLSPDLKELVANGRDQREGADSIGGGRRVCAQYPVSWHGQVCGLIQ